MDEWVGFYERVLGFENIIHYDDETINTEYSALMSKVMADGEEDQVPDQRAGRGEAQGQIAEYLEYNGGPGVSTSRRPTTSCDRSRRCRPASCS
jgi:4-hydroxyphenylpyruvate dioxygenase